jgi:hypothetical protein
MGEVITFKPKPAARAEYLRRLIAARGQNPIS